MLSKLKAPLNRNNPSRLTQFNEYSPIIWQFYKTKNLRQIWRVGPFVFVDNVAHTSRCQRSPSPHPVTDTLRQFRVLDLSKLLHVSPKLLHAFFKLLHVFFKPLHVFLPILSETRSGSSGSWSPPGNLVQEALHVGAKDIIHKLSPPTRHKIL